MKLEFHVGATTSGLLNGIFAYGLCRLAGSSHDPAASAAIAVFLIVSFVASSK